MKINKYEFDHFTNMAAMSYKVKTLKNLLLPNQ